jgi:hypothetical protein
MALTLTLTRTLTLDTGITSTCDLMADGNAHQHHSRMLVRFLLHFISHPSPTIINQPPTDSVISQVLDVVAVSCITTACAANTSSNKQHEFCSWDSEYDPICLDMLHSMWHVPLRVPWPTGTWLTLSLSLALALSVCL